MDRDEDVRRSANIKNIPPSSLPLPRSDHETRRLYMRNAVTYQSDVFFTPIAFAAGVASNEKADEWAKIAAEEPDARGVELLSYLGRVEARANPLPRSLAHLKREISEKKWAEARQWAGGRTTKNKYRMPKSQRPDGTVSGSTKRLASRFYQVKTGTAFPGSTSTGQGAGPPHVLVVRIPGSDSKAFLQGLSGVEGPARNSVGRGAEGDWKVEEPLKGSGPSGRWEMQPAGTRLPLHHGCGKAGSC